MVFSKYIRQRCLSEDLIGCCIGVVVLFKKEKATYYNV